MAPPHLWEETGMALPHLREEMGMAPPHLREEMGMAPARRRISSCTGVHCTHVMPSATRRLWISL